MENIGFDPQFILQEENTRTSKGENRHMLAKNRTKAKSVWENLPQTMAFIHQAWRTVNNTVKTDVPAETDR